MNKNKAQKSKRPVGTGLKPRGQATEAGQYVEDQPETASADEVQPQGEPEPVEEGSEVPETGQDLEVQNLDPANETIVADEPEVPQAAFDLMKVMQESANAASGVDPEALRAATPEELEAMKAAHPLIVTDVTAEDVDRMLAEHGGYDIRVDPANSKLQFRNSLLGHQSNGNFVVAVTLNEYYVESCKQFAEADKTTLEDWCSRFFNSTLEAYCKPNKGR